MKTIFYLRNRLTISESPVKGCMASEKNPDSKTIRKLIRAFMAEAPFNGCIYGDADRIWKQFRRQFDFMEAAGGLVLNEQKEILAIYRLETWDLPKGKLEKGEKRRDAALREVEEECGVTGLSIQKCLEPTYHTYRLKGKNILKKTHWYLMHCGSGQKLVPQTEEHITEIRWVSKDRFVPETMPTYPTIETVLGQL